MDWSGRWAVAAVAHVRQAAKAGFYSTPYAHHGVYHGDSTQTRDNSLCGRREGLVDNASDPPVDQPVKVR